MSAALAKDAPEPEPGVNLTTGSPAGKLEVIRVTIHRYRCKHCLRAIAQKHGLPFYWDEKEEGTGLPKDWYIEWETCPEHLYLDADEQEVTQARLPIILPFPVADATGEKLQSQEDKPLEVRAPSKILPEIKTPEEATLLALLPPLPEAKEEKKEEKPPTQVKLVPPEDPARASLFDLAWGEMRVAASTCPQSDAAKAIVRDALFRRVPDGGTEPLTMRALPSWMSA